MKYDKLTEKKKRLVRFKPFPQDFTQNLDEWFRVELTYTSNAIEGNTLTRQETALVLEKGMTIGGKTLKEHREATNHAAAWEWVTSFAKKHTRRDFTEKNILSLHELILNDIDDSNAGRYRRVPVRVAGSTVIFPNAAKISTHMNEFVQWLQHSRSLHTVKVASEAHYRLVTLHPFIDGNGRTARLLMNLILLMGGYPPAIINTKERLKYLSSLEKAQLGGSRSDFDQLIYDAVNRSLDLYLRDLEEIRKTKKK